MDLIILGIDGADPEYLEKSLEEYDLENWERLREECFYTELPTTVPALTLPAWPCMFSGYRPDQLESYHMGVTDLEEWTIKYTDSGSYEGFPFWDRISGTVGLHNVPGTSPIYPVNGWAREGFPSPVDFRFYPEELGDEIRQKIDPVNRGSHAQLTARKKIDTERENFETEQKIADQILDKDPDVFAGVFQFVDRSGHFAEKQDHVLESYSEVDDLVGKYINRAEEKDANLLVVSDHGFQHADTKLNLVRFLVDLGYSELEESESGESTVYRIVEPLLDTPLKKYLKYMHDFISSTTGRDFSTSESVLGSVSRDSEVVPFFSEGREAGLIVHTSDYPHGSVDPSEREKILDGIETELQKLEKDGEKVIEEIWRGEELYPEDDESPDMVFKTREGFLVSTAPSSKLFTRTNSFTHSDTGVFFAKGPDIDGEAEEEMEIYDVAPLIYTLLDEPVPDDVHGSFPSGLVEDKTETREAEEVSGVDF